MEEERQRQVVLAKTCHTSRNMILITALCTYDLCNSPAPRWTIAP